MSDEPDAGQRAPVAVVDSGGANIRSLGYALERLGYRYRFTNDAADIVAASHVILPGVGHIDAAMRTLQRHRLECVIPQLRQPVLGICVGMQLLFQRSQEGELPLLGIIDGEFQHFPAGQIVPHMGWNTCQFQQPEAPLLAGLDHSVWFYFVHSYYTPPAACTLASCHYGLDFNAIVQQRNFYGCQFHPERSAAAGARLLNNFLTLPSPIMADNPGEQR